MTVEIPSDASRARRIALVVAVAVVALALAGVGVWAMMRPTSPPPTKVIDPAQETSATTLPPAPAASATAGAEPTSTPAGGATTTTSPAAAGSSKVAFRLGGRICVSKADGSHVAPVAPIAETYELSPDGSTLAVVYASTDELPEGCSAGSIALFDVATKAVRCVGQDVAPLGVSWAPDSRSLAYTAVVGSSFAVRRVAVVGEGVVRRLSAGSGPVFSADGSKVAFARSEDPGSDDELRVRDLEHGTTVSLPGSGGALAYGWGPDGELYYTMPSPQGAWDLVRVEPNTSVGTVVGSIVLQAPAFALSTVMVSPDGARVLVSATGDDDYSRLWLFEKRYERFVEIPTRRDASPCCWSRDGRILYFEGNHYQGESSALASILPDGTGRRVVAPGAIR